MSTNQRQQKEETNREENTTRRKPIIHFDCSDCGVFDISVDLLRLSFIVHCEFEDYISYHFFVFSRFVKVLQDVFIVFVQLFQDKIRQ